MSDIIDRIEWALETKRDKPMFGLDELNAALSRERRLFGVLLDCKKEIDNLRGLISEHVDNSTIKSHKNLCEAMGYTWEKEQA